MKFVFAALLFCAAANSGAAEKLRYLFLIEHTPEMATRQLAIVQTVHDIIRSGFEGEIKEGEKFALYFYGSRLQPTRPFTWRKGSEIALARQAANLFSGRVYSRLRPPDETLADAAAHVEVSPEVTVFFFTGGNVPITGTPFDAKINEAIEQRRALFMSADKPFVVTFVARNQTLVDGRVHADVNAPFQIPETDREDAVMAKALQTVRNVPPPKANDPADLEKALAAVRNAPPVTDQTDKARATLRDALVAKTNTPIPVEALRFSPALKDPPVEVKAEPPVVVATPPAEKRETAPPVEEVKPKPVEVAVAAPPPVEPTPEPKPVVREEPKARTTPPVVAPAPGAKATVVEPTRVVQEEPKSIPPLTPAPPPAVAKPVTNVVVTKQEVAIKPAPPVVGTTVVANRKTFPWPALFGGLVAIAIGGAVAIVRAKRRASSPGSIITQALPPHITRKPPH